MPGPVVKHLFDIKVVDRHHCKTRDKETTQNNLGNIQEIATVSSSDKDKQSKAVKLNSRKKLIKNEN